MGSKSVMPTTSLPLFFTYSISLPAASEEAAAEETAEEAADAEEAMGAEDAAPPQAVMETAIAPAITAEIIFFIILTPCTTGAEHHIYFLALSLYYDNVIT